MGLLTDYFAAPSDGLAARAVDRLGGPGVPPFSPPPSTPEPRRLRFGRRGTAGLGGRGEPVFPTVSSNGIEPVVAMGTVHALLTGRDPDDVLDDPSEGVLVAATDDGERLVVRLSDGLTAVLAGCDDDRLRDVAARWVATDDLCADDDPAPLAVFLVELAGLARRAHARGEHLYCWVCV